MNSPLALFAARTLSKPCRFEHKVWSTHFPRPGASVIKEPMDKNAMFIQAYSCSSYFLVMSLFFVLLSCYVWAIISLRKDSIFSYITRGARAYEAIVSSKFQHFRLKWWDVFRIYVTCFRIVFCLTLGYNDNSLDFLPNEDFCFSAFSKSWSP